MRFLPVFVLMAFLGLVSVSTAQDPEWFVRKNTKIETYIASVNKIIELDKKAGINIPACRNETTLPLISYPINLQGVPKGEFRIDVSGVEKLYIGSPRSVRLRGVMLDSGDGVAQPIRSADGKTELVKLTPIEERRMSLENGGDLHLRDSEVAIELNGKYKWISGNFYAGHELVWMDTVSRFETYGKAGQLRYGLTARIGWRGREFAHDIELLPSVYQPLTLKKASTVMGQAISQAKHARDCDPVILSAMEKAVADVNTAADYDRAKKMCYAAINFKSFSGLRRSAGGVKEVPGLLTKFDATLKKDYYQLDPAKFDYQKTFPIKQEEWKDLINQVKLMSTYIEIVNKTIDLVSKTDPSVASAKEEAAELQKKLLASGSDLDKYIAVHEQMQALRREVFYRLPIFNFDSILINRNPPTTLSHNSDQHLGRHSRIGKGLAIVSGWKTGKPQVKTILEGKLPPGAYRNPDLSYDGKRVVFAFCDHTVEDPNLRRFFLYEAAIDGSWVRQLTGTKRDSFKTWDNRVTVLIEDNDPCYLPDGGIVFISTRCQSFGRCHNGRYSPAWNLHRCDKDGSNIKQLSFANENEVEPSVLNDGRIVFTRWEYTNRSEVAFHKLWWCRPDGSNVSHFFGNDMVAPHQFLEAKAIPGTHKVVCTGQGHHFHTSGTTVVIDTNIDENGEHAITHITPETPYSETHGSPMIHYSHPYGLSEDVFLASRADHRVHSHVAPPPPVAGRGIYLVDTMGGRDLIYEDAEVASVSPIPLRPRTRPPVLPSMVKANAKPYGILSLQNVYLTRKENDPNGVIKPGMIKALRVNALGVQPRAHRVSCTMTAPNSIPKKVLGTVPINADGSVILRVPANVSLQVQTLDENGMAILTEKSLFYLQPGERRSCVGCHEPVGAAPNQAQVVKMSLMEPLDLKPAAGPQYEGGMSFARTVQPVLDRHCIKCHGLEKKEKNVDLTYITKGKGRYPQSLIEIVNRGKHQLGQVVYMREKYAGTDVTYNISHPRKFFAYENKVAQMLAKGDKNHEKLIDVDRESYMRIIEWLDLNGQCYGDLFPNKIEDRSFDAAGLTALRSYAEELFGEKISGQPSYALVNLAQPDESRILMMPLPVDQGGWGQGEELSGAVGFKSKDDPAYKKMADLVEGCIVRQANENTNGWNPTWEMGASERWVKEARAEYLDRLKEKAGE